MKCEVIFRSKCKKYVPLQNVSSDILLLSVVICIHIQYVMLSGFTFYIYFFRFQSVNIYGQPTWRLSPIEK